MGPGCPSYDGIAGQHAGGTGGNDGTGGTAGEDGISGTGGTAGEDGTSGTGGSPDGGVVDPPTDGGADANPPPVPCEVAFVTPTASNGAVTLSEPDDVDGAACGVSFSTPVVVATNASTVNLFVNGSPTGEQVVANEEVALDVVLGNRGSTSNVLRADAVMADGSTCSVTFGADLFVDCPGPSCSIESPVANDDGYLNASQDDDTNTADLQADIVIATEDVHAGQPVRLEIDTVFDSVAAVNVAVDGNATFTAVTLEEGERTVRAECRDAAGIVTLSAPVVWNVDITACGLSIDSVAGDADPVTRLQDFDTNPSNGLQVEVAGELTGDDCDVIHVGECGGDLSDIDVAGNPGDFSGLVTLGNETGSVSVCASVDDLAGNESSPVTQVDVNVRATDPAVAIASPLSGARFNLLGTSGATPDGNQLTPATCEVDVAVDCTDVGVAVELLVGSDVVASQNCVAQGGLDAPFLGRASFSSVSLLTQNDGSLATLSARQTVAGLVGTSANVTVQADCQAPSCDITAPAPSAFLNAADDSSGDAGFQVGFTVQTDATEIGQNVQLTIDGDGSGSLSSLAAAGGGGALATFADVSLDEGSREVQAECVDAAGNVQTSDVEEWVVDTTPCTTTLVVAGAANPVTPLDDEDPVGAGLQVPVTGQTVGGDCDSVRVGICDALSGGASALALDGSFALETTLASVTGSVNVCAEISDVAGNLGVQPVTVNIDVDGPSLTIESPLDQAVFNSNSADCDAGTAGLQISVTGLSDAEEGSTVDVSLGLGAASQVAVVTGAYTACVEAPQGNDQTLTATVLDDLTGLEATASITVSVDTQAPGSIGPLTVAVTGRRQGTLNVSWDSVLDTDGDPLAAYRLRCATTDITDELTWGTATDIPVALTPSATPGTTETVGLTSFRTGTSRFCAVRGEDENGQLGAITTSIVANPFLQQPYTIRDDGNNINTVGNVVVEPLGDINGDTIADFMYGALNANLGGAQVFFGTTTLDPQVPETADITIDRTGTASGFGGEATGLGDISGDGIPDFAVSARLPANNTVYVFFGRENTDPVFPATIDAAGAACPAGVDLCVVGTAVPNGGGLFSWDVHGANFDGSGANDLVISARTANSIALGAGRVYVLLGGAQLAAATNRIVTIPADAVTTLDEVDGFIIDPPAARAHFGFSVTSLDSSAGVDDLIIGANGQPPVGTAAAVGAVYHLTGRAYTAGAGSGLISIASTELTEIETGLLANFGNPVRAIGDFNGDGAGDFAMGHNYTSFGAVRVYLRSGVGGTFSSSSVLNFLPLGDGNDDNYGLYMANGEYPGLGLLGDLDNDDISDLLIGADDPDTAGACPGGAQKGVAQLFYGADPAVARTRAQADFSYTATVGQVVPNFVGDINQDGFNDFALLDSGCGTNTLILMY